MVFLHLAIVPHRIAPVPHRYVEQTVIGTARLCIGIETKLPATMIVVRRRAPREYTPSLGSKCILRISFGCGRFEERDGSVGRAKERPDEISEKRPQKPAELGRHDYRVVGRLQK